MPLLNLGLVAEMDKSKAQQSVAYYQYVQTVRAGFADVDNSLSQHDSYQNMVHEEDIALQTAQSIKKSLQLKYKLGAVSYADTIGAQLDVDYVRSSNNQTKIQQMGSIVQLYQALGGGYDAKPLLDQK